MANRMHATPMDFQYENGTGPLDERSPFAQVGRNSQRNNGGSINDKKRTSPDAHVRSYQRSTSEVANRVS